MAGEELGGFELDIDSEQARIRRWREERLMEAGVAEFPAFRLAMVQSLDYRKVVKLKRAGASDEWLLDEFLDLEVD